jgi:hypothetical protein
MNWRFELPFFRCAALCLILLCTIPSLCLASKESPSDIENLRSEIFRKTGIVTANHFSSLNTSVLESIKKVLVSGLPPEGARKLRALHFVGGQSLEQNLVRTEATYSYKDKLITIFSPPAHKKRHDFQSELCATIAHEVGHAAAFSFLTGDELVQLAREHGPWQNMAGFDETITSLWDSRLRQRHPDFEAPISILRSHLKVPSRYALENAHEWFAEVFSAWVMKNIQLTTHAEPYSSHHFSVPSRTAAALANLFDKTVD